MVDMEGMHQRGEYIYSKNISKTMGSEMGFQWRVAKENTTAPESYIYRLKLGPYH
jgi:hypothetical protein